MKKRDGKKIGLHFPSHPSQLKLISFFLLSDLYALHGPVRRPGSQIQVNGCSSGEFGYRKTQVLKSGLPGAPTLWGLW